MKILQINTFYNFGSTGRITYDLKLVHEANGIESFVAFGPNSNVNFQLLEDNSILKLQNLLQRKWSIFCNRLFDHHGFYNITETRKLLCWIDLIKPDVIHLHNIHNHYVNVEMLFKYIKQHDIPVVWTLHDCWSFTGHCAYFDYVGCEKWKSGCHNCPSLRDYPPTWFLDRTKKNFADKKVVFKGVKNLTIVSPSKWLGSLAKESFLKEYPVEVINNGVDTNIFKPSSCNVKKRYNLFGKKIILAVVAGDTKRKGSDILRKIPSMLNDEEVLVWVGINEKDSKISDPHFLSISHTNSRKEMAELYSAADCMINPTLEDNFPTVNIESLACGTPVVTFNTGGSIEAVLDYEKIIYDSNIQYSSVGAVVDKGNIVDLLTATRNIMSRGKDAYQQKCVLKANLYYEKSQQYLKYIETYKRIVCK